MRHCKCCPNFELPTHCKHGHPADFIINSQGGRVCRTCKGQSERRYLDESGMARRLSRKRQHRRALLENAVARPQRASRRKTADKEN